MNKEINDLISAIQSVLTEDLLTPKYKNKERNHITEGHCYICSEALYHMMGGKGSGLFPQVASWSEGDERLSHWYLIDKDKNIVDPTKEQFLVKGINPPYNLGHGCGYLTKLPSKRASVIILRVSEKLGLVFKDISVSESVAEKNRPKK